MYFFNKKLNEKIKLATDKNSRKNDLPLTRKDLGPDFTENT